MAYQQFNPFTQEDNEIIQWAQKESQSWNGETDILMPQDPTSHDAESYNFEVQVLAKTYSAYDKQTIRRYHVKGNLTQPTNPDRFCLYVMDVDLYGIDPGSQRRRFTDQDTGSIIIPIGVQGTSGVFKAPTFRSSGPDDVQVPWIDSERRWDITTHSITYSNDNQDNGTVNMNNTSWQIYSSSLHPNLWNAFYITAGQIQDLHNIFECTTGTYTYEWNHQLDAWVAGFLTRRDKHYCNYRKLPDFIPVFNNKVAVVNYLMTGDDSGRIDPFPNSNPPRPVPTQSDALTTFHMYVGGVSKVIDSTISMPLNEYGGTLQIQAVNQFCVENSGVSDHKFDVFYRQVLSSLRPQASIYPSPIDKEYHNTTNDYVGCGMHYKDNIITPDSQGKCIYNMSYFILNPEDETYYSYRPITVTFHFDPSKEFGCVVEEVGAGTSADYTVLGRTALIDDPLSDKQAWKYEDPNGNTLIIHWRKQDIIGENPYTPDYDWPDPEEDEDESTDGEDRGLYTGTGLRTYKLSTGDLDLVNTSFWTTDWDTLWKSKTTDPMQSVISCKGIPFTANTSATSTVYVGPLEVTVAGGSYCTNTVKTFSYTLVNSVVPCGPKGYRFTSVRIFLPYIGWKEIPRSFAIKNTGSVMVGGVLYQLQLSTVKYIVDFVDGLCRAIVINSKGQELYFDGNCGVDTPLTSDNHTEAVSSAIKTAATGGLKLVAGVASAVGSGYMGNVGGVVGGVTTAASGAIQLTQTVPAYEYEASCSPSGRIECAMRDNIQIEVTFPQTYIPSSYQHEIGLPCYNTRGLGSLHGFTRCVDSQVSGINAPKEELDLIKQYLDTGVYL